MISKVYYYASKSISLLILTIAIMLPQRVIAASESESGTVGTVINAVVADIDGEPLTMGDLKQHIISQGQQPPVDLQNGNSQVRKFLQDMVLKQLLKREAQESGIQVSSEEVESYIGEIRRQNGVDNAQFVELLKGQGITEQNYRKVVEHDIIRARVVARKVRSKIQIVDEDIGRFLELNPERFPKEGTVHLQQILLRHADSGGARGASEREIKALREKILSGSNFAQAGGSNYLDMGFVSIEELKPELQFVALKLETGVVSDVIATDIGYSLLLLSAKAGSKGELDPVFKEQIKKELYDVALKEELDKFLNVKLPDKYKVEMKF